MDEETNAWLDEREKVRVEANRQLSNSDFAAMQEHEDRQRKTFNHRIQDIMYEHAFDMNKVQKTFAEGREVINA